MVEFASDDCHLMTEFPIEISVFDEQSITTTFLHETLLYWM